MTDSLKVLALLAVAARAEGLFWFVIVCGFAGSREIATAPLI
jgi:hypothetical protein